MSNLDLSTTPIIRTEGSMVEECGLTKREYFAGLLRVPESGDPDLDAMIRTAQRRDLAAMAMQGMLAEDAEAYTFEGLAVASLKTADALLSALSHPVAEKEST